MSLSAFLRFLMEIEQNNQPVVIPFDYTPKEVGDKVEIIKDSFFNYFIDIDNNEQLVTDCNFVNEEVVALFKKYPMIVVANNLNKEYTCGHCDQLHYHDIIVYIPELKKRFFTSAKEVKHIL